MRALLNKKVSGQIAFPLLLTAVTMTGVAIYTAMTYVNAQIAPVEAQTVQNETAIAEVNTNLAWIKAALTAKGITPNTN